MNEIDLEAVRIYQPNAMAAAGSVRALEETGKLYAVYLHHGRVVRDAKPRYKVDTETKSVQITLQLPPGNYSAAWRDTRNGLDVKLDKFEVAAPDQSARLTSPVYAQDIALIVRATKASGR